MILKKTRFNFWKLNRGWEIVDRNFQDRDVERELRILFLEIKSYLMRSFERQKRDYGREMFCEERF